MAIEFKSTEQNPKDGSYSGWWLAILLGVIVSIVGYWGYAQGTNTEIDAAEKSSGQLPSMLSISNEQLVAISNDLAAMKEAAVVYETNCMACHGPNGEGGIGPSLIDDEWRYGGSGLEILSSIAKGRGKNQMPAWEPILGEETVVKMAAYVLSMDRK